MKPTGGTCSASVANNAGGSSGSTLPILPLPDWQQHCEGVRARFRASLGPLPERTPLNAQVTGRLERDGYTVEKLLLESQPGFYVTANLYLPVPGRFPAPAILNPVGHWRHGKAEDLVQARGIGLARHGYVALIYDPIGQEERSQERESVQRRNPQPAATRQHAAAGLPCTLIGQTIINHILWDGVRMLDYLESRPEVDATRIGCTGASGGGYQTMFLNALDPRIKSRRAGLLDRHARAHAGAGADRRSLPQPPPRLYRRPGYGRPADVRRAQRRAGDRGNL